MNTDKTNKAMPDPARLSSASLSNDEAQKVAIDEGVRRMEGIIKGQTTRLTESDFRQAFR